MTYTEPEVGRAGLNEREAKARGIAVEVTRYDLHELDRAIVDDAREGFVKVLTPPGKDRILGVTIVAPRAGEMLSEMVLAMRHGIGLKKVFGTVHSRSPSLSPIARQAMCSAAVALFTATACAAPTRDATAASNRVTAGPCVRKSDRSTATTASMSAWVMSWRP